jgi:type VI secretion system protein ImpE
MNAKDLIAAGKLTEARARLTADVKAAPSDVGKRVLLFQALSFLGEWEKAERHLDMIVSLSPASETGVQVYVNVVHAEKERGDVMAGRGLPGFVTGTPPYLDLYFEGWSNLKEGKPEEAALIYERVEAQRRPVSGNIEGKKFDGFFDTDAFLWCFLEIIVHDRYIWVPFDSIRELAVDPPKTLFDLLWIPARIMTWEGMSLHCYIPVLYVDSSAQADERIKMGRMTDWLPLGGTFHKGVGQRVLQAGEDDIPLLEMRGVSFDYALGEEQS